MAGDLIPPPSPARRSDPDAEPKATAELEEAVQAAADAGQVDTGPSPFRSRFGFLFGVLAGVALCAAGALVLLIATDRDTGPRLAANWSEWEPDTTRMADGAEEIAAHLGLQYKLDGGGQLASIASSPLELQGEEIGVAVRPQGSPIEILEGDGVLYIQNGLGAPGTSATSAPSKKRERLLQRQALELALYSFRYLDDVTMVAVLLPQTTEQSSAARAGQPPQRRAVFYRPGDLIEQLQVPLARTLSPRTPTPSSMSKAESAKVDSLTLRNLFVASILPLEADRNYLVLVEPDADE